MAGTDACGCIRAAALHRNATKLVAGEPLMIAALLPFTATLR
jgi:hypothetical protein